MLMHTQEGTSINCIHIMFITTCRSTFLSIGCVDRGTVCLNQLLMHALYILLKTDLTPSGQIRMHDLTGTRKLPEPETEVVVMFS